MKKLHHLLVGVDFSPICASALKTAVRLAAINQAKLTIIHVVDPWLADEFKRAFGHNTEQLISDVDRKVRAFIEQIGVDNHPYNVVVTIEHPVVALERVGKKIGADLVVLGTRGTDHHPNEMGAVAAKCARKLPMDVLLIRKAHEDRFHKVTACVDFSETSQKALKMAAQLAQIDKARLATLHICQSPMMLSLNYAGFLPEVPWQEREVAMESKHHLDTFVSDVLVHDEQDIKPKNVVVEHVSIREAIVAYLETNDTDLLVFGTQGQSHIKDFLIGTAAETIVKHASCSVLVVKPDPAPEIIY